MEEPGREQAELAVDGMGSRQWGRRLHIDIVPPGPRCLLGLKTALQLELRGVQLAHRASLSPSSVTA